MLNEHHNIEHHDTEEPVSPQARILSLIAHLANNAGCPDCAEKIIVLLSAGTTLFEAPEDMRHHHETLNDILTGDPFCEEEETEQTYVCQCDCGNRFVVGRSDLESGKVVCCPDCSKKETP